MDEPYAANKAFVLWPHQRVRRWQKPLLDQRKCCCAVLQRQGWRTLAVCFGPAGSRLAYCFLSLLAYLAPVVLWSLGGYGAWVLLPLATLPLALQVLPIVLTHEDEPTLEPMTAKAAMLTFIYAALLAIGIAAG